MLLSVYTILGNVRIIHKYLNKLFDYVSLYGESWKNVAPGTYEPETVLMIGRTFSILVSHCPRMFFLPPIKWLSSVSTWCFHSQQSRMHCNMSFIFTPDTQCSVISTPPGTGICVLSYIVLIIYRCVKHKTYVYVDKSVENWSNICFLFCSITLYEVILWLYIVFIFHWMPVQFLQVSIYYIFQL